ncbi:hypothetical protein OIU74_016434 [Salix koriyanagi]|uniref:Uncharacterized protein n=1 Tax=Salix koriyanagi TaxID=2511006 RepID=A0A9Q0SS70_9ROSI|nr:hypothetical protein OIU74_016434 [Salix koriyanagi]
MSHISNLRLLFSPLSVPPSPLNADLSLYSPSSLLHLLIQNDDTVPLQTTFLLISEAEAKLRLERPEAETETKGSPWTRVTQRERGERRRALLGYASGKEK